MTHPSTPSDPCDGWQPARLIPAPGDSRAADAVKAATETVLAVLGAVPELARQVLRHVDAPRGRVRTFSSLTLEDGQTGKRLRPDGALVVEHGDQVWRCLLHARTGTDPVRKGAVEKLVRVAVQHGFDAVLSVSSEIGVAPGVCPVVIDRDVRRSVALVHLSWFRILTHAVLCRDTVAMDDPAQGLLVDELVDFLRHPRSHTAANLDMGSHWTAVRSAVRSGKVRPQGPPVRQAVERWQRLGHALALRLSQHARVAVSVVEPSGMTRSERDAWLAQGLADDGCLRAELRVPGAAGPVTVEADLARREIRAALELRAPRDGSARTRVAWLLRQLRAAPDGLAVDTLYGRTATGPRALEKLRDDPDLALLQDDAEREPTRFRLVFTAPLGTSATTFACAVEHQLLELHDHVVSQVKEWAPPVEARVPEPVAAEPVQQFYVDPERWGPPADLLSGFPGADAPEG